MPTPVLESLTVGDVVASAETHLTRESLVRYAGASGDFNPIHYRDDVAESVGLPSVVAHGMLTMGIASQVAVDWAGDPACVVDYQVRFTRPVVVDRAEGATLVVSAAIGVIDAEARRVRLDLTATESEQAVLGRAQAWISLA